MDAPEVDARFPDRVKAQADYFGISKADALKVGEEAAKFTRLALSKRFAVDTRFQDAMDASKLPREYGVVTVEGKDLGEMLVERGLARIHGINVGDIGAGRQHDLMERRGLALPAATPARRSGRLPAQGQSIRRAHLARQDRRNHDKRAGTDDKDTHTPC